MSLFLEVNGAKMSEKAAIEIEAEEAAQLRLARKQVQFFRATPRKVPATGIRRLMTLLKLVSTSNLAWNVKFATIFLSLLRYLFTLRLHPFSLM